jgi:hypothetical protein
VQCSQLGDQRAHVVLRGWRICKRATNHGVRSSFWASGCIRAAHHVAARGLRPVENLRTRPCRRRTSARAVFAPRRRARPSRRAGRAAFRAGAGS